MTIGVYKTSLSIAEDKIKEHIEYIDKDIKLNARDDRFEFCKELQAVRRGLQHALDDIQEVKVSVLVGEDTEFAELPPAIYELIQTQAERIKSAEHCLNAWMSTSKVLCLYMESLAKLLPAEVITKESEFFEELKVLKSNVEAINPLEV